MASIPQGSRFLHSHGCISHRSYNARMSSTPADVAFHKMPDLRFRWIRIRLQQRHRSHDHSRRAVSALHRCLVEKRLLHWMQPLAGGQPFNSRDLSVAHCSHRSNARSARTSIDQHRAGAALPFAATIFTSRKIQLIAQHPEQAGIRVGIDRERTSIHIELRNRRHSIPPALLYLETTTSDCVAIRRRRRYKTHRYAIGPEARFTNPHFRVSTSLWIIAHAKSSVGASTTNIAPAAPPATRKLRAASGYFRR